MADPVATSIAQAGKRSRTVLCFVSDELLATSHQDWLLWPAHAFRVSVPMRGSRTLDLFERVVLELGVAGSLLREHIAQAAGLLHLDVQLLLLVATQLQRKKLLDVSLRATPEGEAAVDQSWIEEREEKIVWMYADASARVWPTTHGERAGAVPAKWKGAQRVNLNLGTVGNSTERHAVVVRLPSTERAVTERDVRIALEVQTIDEPSELADRSAIPDVSRLDHVAIVPGGEAVYLAAPMWSDDPAESRLVCDPMTGRGSEELTRLIEDVSARDTILQERWARHAEQGPLIPLVVRPEDTTVAEQRLEHHVGPRLRRTAIWNRCVECERALLAVEVLDGAVRPERIRHVNTEAQAVIELLFQQLLEAFRTVETVTAADSLAEGDSKEVTRTNRVALEGHARRFGAELPFNMGIQSRRKLQKALKDGQESLRALVPAAVLVASRIEGHPLAAAIRRDPDILKRIDAIAGKRNSSAHATTVLLTAADARDAVNEVHHILRLIELPEVAVGASLPSPIAKAM